MDGREEAPPFGHVSGARERRVNDEEEGTIVGSGPTRADSEYTRHAMSLGEGEDWVLPAEALKVSNERLHAEDEKLRERVDKSNELLLPA